MASSGFGMGGMMPMIMLLIGGVALYLFGCQLGICALCSPTGKTNSKCQPGGSAPSTPAPATGTPSTTSAATTNPPPMTAQQISAASGFPAVTLTEGIQYVANQIVNDIDKNTFQQFSSAFVLNLEADILENHQNDLALIYNYNGMSLQPLQGRALAAYSQLLLTVAREHGIALNPAYEAMTRSNLFAGSPVVINQTSGASLAIAFA